MQMDLARGAGPRTGRNPQSGRDSGNPLCHHQDGEHPAGLRVDAVLMLRYKLAAPGNDLLRDARAGSKAFIGVYHALSPLRLHPNTGVTLGCRVAPPSSAIIAERP